MPTTAGFFYLSVVLYGRYSYPTYEQKWPGKSAGHLAAMRCALLMLWAGVEDVRILNGGIHSWEDAGYELSTTPTRPEPVDSVGAAPPLRSELIVDLSGARRLLGAEDSACRFPPSPLAAAAAVGRSS